MLCRFESGYVRLIYDLCTGYLRVICGVSMTLSTGIFPNDALRDSSMQTKNHPDCWDGFQYVNMIYLCFCEVESRAINALVAYEMEQTWSS